MSISLRDLTDRFDVLFDAWERADRRLYLVGGCVRDVIMELDAIGDIDLTTDALPDETTQLLRKAGFPAYPIGARFGTISTIVDGVPIEITTFRVEEHYQAGNRKPNVTFGSDLAHDLSRRDLSINAMAAGRRGTLHDPFDGQGAIERRILEVPRGGLQNTIGILRDDPLRLLRIARFAARFGFTPTEDTTNAAKATSQELLHISHERWKMELDKMLVAPRAGDGLRWLHDVGALTVLFPSLAPCAPHHAQLVEAVERTHVERMTRWAVLLLAAAWCRQVGTLPALNAPPECHADGARAADFATRAARHFRFSNEEREMARRLCGAPVPSSVLNGTWTRLERRRFIAEWGGLYAAALELSFAWSPMEHADYAPIRAALDDAFLHEDVVPRLPPGLGKHVIDDLGVPRGPAVAMCIERIRAAIVDGELANGSDTATYIAFLRADGAEPAAD